jgi:hypothetical protein
MYLSTVLQTPFTCVLEEIYLFGYMNTKRGGVKGEELQSDLQAFASVTVIGT